MGNIDTVHVSTVVAPFNSILQPGMFTMLVASAFWMKFRLDLVEPETTSGCLSHKVARIQYSPGILPTSLESVSSFSSGVWPDIVTIGKPMGNGHPIAAVVTSKKIAKAFATANNVKIFEEVWSTCTPPLNVYKTILFICVVQSLSYCFLYQQYGADPVSLAVADAVMTVIEEENLQKHAKELGGYIMDGFLKLSKVHHCIGDVR